MKTIDLFYSNSSYLDQPLKVGIQKSGRLYEESLDFFKGNNIDIAFAKNGFYQSQNTNLQFYFLREKDISRLVANEKLDMGIVGLNTYTEYGQGNLEYTLDFSKCRLCFAVPEESALYVPQDFEGKTIATSYPKILSAYLEKNNIRNVSIETYDGSVETISNLCNYDGIVDLVETGNSLKENNFRELQTILLSEAVLITCNSLNQELQQRQNARLFTRYQLENR